MSKINYNISAKETTYNGCVFRSRLEATWAAFFDLIGWDWIYEPVDLEGWSPDFLIKGTQDILVEVKPITEFHYDTCKKIDKTYPEGRVMLLGCSPAVPNYFKQRNGETNQDEDKFCWFRSLRNIGWAKELGFFVSHFQPDSSELVYAWTVSELSHYKDIDL